VTLLSRARAIADDREAGASELLARLLPVLTAALESSPQDVLAFARLICRRQPMAALWHACAAAVDDADHPGTFARVRMEMERAPRALDRAAAITLRELLTDEDSPLILTLSYSGSVARVLGELAGERRMRIVCGEGRPRFEGRRLAAALHDRSAEVTLVIDAALTTFLPDASAIVLGADAVCSTRWINKVGSLGLCAAANLRGTPVYVIASHDKFVPNVLESALALPLGPPEEVWGAAAGIARVNAYFEFVPAELATLFLTDRGRLSPADLPHAVESGAESISILLSRL